MMVPGTVRICAGIDHADRAAAGVVACFPRRVGPRCPPRRRRPAAGDVVDSVAGFALWVGRLLRQADTSRPVSEDRVHASYWWIAEDGTYLGAITLRHELNDFLLRAAGHIGYGIRPSARGRGLATWALRSVLVRAPALGLRKVLVTCGDSNLASARVIEKSGGVLEDVHDTELGLTRRYWITL